jgi:hypothetical protein
MASKEDCLKFMSEVRKVSGVDTLTPDETGLVSIRVDDAYNVNLQFVEATGKILCFVEVVQLPPDAPHNDESIFNLSDAVLYLDGGDTATFVVPLGENPASRFFKVELPRTP